MRAGGGMVDALASGASVRKGVGVRIPPRARLTMGIIPCGVVPIVSIRAGEFGRSGSDGSPLAHRGR